LCLSVFVANLLCLKHGRAKEGECQFRKCL
jgi:hypothetical protein